MGTTDLETRIKSLEEEVTALKDIHEIEQLQRIYGYYKDNDMLEEVIDLFSDKAEYIELTDEGRYLGKKGIRKFFRATLQEPLRSVMKDYFAARLIVQGAVTLDPGGKTAHGRWQLLGLIAQPTGPNQKVALVNASVYENGYIKEGGKWKITKVVLHPYFLSTLEDGWVKNPYVTFHRKIESWSKADIPATGDKTYPTGYRLPLHFKNPVTGK